MLIIPAPVLIQQQCIIVCRLFIKIPPFAVSPSLWKMNHNASPPSALYSYWFVLSHYVFLSFHKRRCLYFQGSILMTLVLFFLLLNFILVMPSLWVLDTSAGSAPYTVCKQKSNTTKTQVFESASFLKHHEIGFVGFTLRLHRVI